MSSKNDPVKNLLWVDLEMSGLDVEKEVIIEVGAIVTDMDFNPLGEYEAVVKQPQSYIDGMDEWNKTHHGASGLIDKIPQGKEPETVELELIRFSKKYFSESEKIILAGNSIGQDRLFINRYFKVFSDLLHYRMLDVTSWKLIFKNKFQLEPEKKNGHRALDDIKESIDEMKYYLEKVKI